MNAIEIAREILQSCGKFDDLFFEHNGQIFQVKAFYLDNLGQVVLTVDGNKRIVVVGDEILDVDLELIENDNADVFSFSFKRREIPS